MSTFINLAMPHPKSVMFSDFPEILQGQGLYERLVEGVVTSFLSRNCLMLFN